MTKRAKPAPLPKRASPAMKKHVKKQEANAAMDAISTVAMRLVPIDVNVTKDEQAYEYRQASDRVRKVFEAMDGDILMAVIACINGRK